MGNSNKPKVVLAYSGGLDTSVILKWLMEEGYEVIAYVADVGQTEDFAAVREKAYAIGASKVVIEDLKKEFVEDYIFTAIKADAIYESRYLLGTSLARPLIAKQQMACARREGAQAVSHGATGKGNDQIRFELAYLSLDPQIQIIAPWKMPVFFERFQGRSDLMAYAEEHGIPVKSTQAKPFSEDDNLFHISHEAGHLEDPNFAADESVYSRTVSPMAAPDALTTLEITFKGGVPVQVTHAEANRTLTDPLELFAYVDELGRANGIGRVDMVENRYVGVKSRGVYETPGGTILLAAHRDLEGIAMDREVMRYKDMLSAKLAEVIYNGFWFSPEMEFLLAAIEKSQEHIDGTVTLTLYKGNVTVIARQSPYSLYNPELSSMDIEGGFHQQDAEGFIRISAIRLQAHQAIRQRL